MNDERIKIFHYETGKLVGYYVKPKKDDNMRL